MNILLSTANLHPYNEETGGGAEGARALVDFAWETFDEGETPDGTNAALTAKLRRLRVVFLMRLVKEITQYVQQMLAVGLCRLTSG